MAFDRRTYFGPVAGASAAATGCARREISDRSLTGTPAASPSDARTETATASGADRSRTDAAPPADSSRNGSTPPTPRR